MTDRLSGACCGSELGWQARKDLDPRPLLYQFWPGRWSAGQGFAILAVAVGRVGSVFGGVAVTVAVSGLTC